MFAVAGGDSISLTTDPAKIQMKSKTLLIVKTEPPGGAAPDAKETNTGLGSRIVFMEFTKPFLESLHNNCSVSFNLYRHAPRPASPAPLNAF